jgi:hypothetical protein
VSSSVSLRRTAAVAAVTFVLILAFLAGRVHAGADPAQALGPAARYAPSAPTTERDPYGSGPSLPPQGAVPSPGGQDFDPPMTHAS